MKNWIVRSDSRVFSSQARNNIAVYLNDEEVLRETAVACCSASFFFIVNIFVCSCIPNTCSLVFKPSRYGSDDAVV